MTLSTSDEPAAEDAPASVWDGVDFAEMLGGRRGIIDASIPGVLLVIVNAFAPLGWAIGAACVSAAVLAVIRLTRGEPLRQAVMGLGGIAVAAGLAAFSGQAKRYFLPGIFLNTGYCLVALVSIAVRRPLLGYVTALIDRGYAHWQEEPGLRRAAMWATALWGVVFALRASVQGYLYVHNKVHWLAPVKLGMGLPLTAVALAGTLLLLEGRRREPDAEEGVTT
ncbi:MAG: DUF3159 domain-containing protein [Frankiaceae bacterium]|nr:DUF3159 domain-containing protein [Frankiaceae bacterium]